jgi:hypothetical protein
MHKYRVWLYAEVDIEAVDLDDAWAVANQYAQDLMKTADLQNISVDDICEGIV